MKLINIVLHNYRSINSLSIDIRQLSDKSYTYGLIGVNEAGKSSLLKGISLPHSYLNELKKKDFRDSNHPIEINYLYKLNDSERNNCINIIVKEHPDKRIKRDVLNLIGISVKIQPLAEPETSINFTDFPMEDFVGIKDEVQQKLYQFLISKIHKIIFWTAEDRYLISKPINLHEFSSDPASISIPLKNCFQLAGITDIPQAILDALSDSTERESLRDELGKRVTEHIKAAWPGHPIHLSFDISDNHIHFHVKDEHTKSKAKTTEQRSDGFRQFISFLLTLSAQERNAELVNTIILLDEPETHLHPKAQEYLLKELTTITSNDKDNIVFFATHSNYMIDKALLERNFKVIKQGDITMVQKLNHKQSTYASVNYDVFDIVSTDYHNELYGRLYELVCDSEKASDIEEKIKALRPDCPIKKQYEQMNGKKYDCTLPTFIRHQIHHPENTKNKKYTEKELSDSIEILLDIISKL